jgi:hypothetical protein
MVRPTVGGFRCLLGSLLIVRSRRTRALVITDERLMKEYGEQVAHVTAGKQVA